MVSDDLDPLNTQASNNLMDTTPAIGDTPVSETIKPVLAGILFIASGVIAIIFWLLLVLSVDTVVLMMDLSQFQSMYPEITVAEITSMLTICGTVLALLGVFPLLTGILSVKRKQWSIALVCGIISLSGLFAIIPGILAVIGLLFLVISRKEFH